MTPTRSRIVNSAFCPPRCRGFTIVEMLMVIGIIMLLLAIMLPSLSAVQSRSRKMTELNYLRQVGMAWNMYANQHNDAAIPGYLDHEGPQSVQKRWSVRFEYPSLPMAGGTPITMDPRIPDEVSAPWTWRLAEYINYSPDVLWGYRGDAMSDVQWLVDNADEVALTPAFGYNSYYVGGWWRTFGGFGDAEGGGISLRPRHSFWDATVDGQPANLVVRSLSTMARPEQLVVFCSATEYSARGTYPTVDDDRPGSHLVTPPTVAQDRKWQVPRVSGAGGGEITRGTGNRHTVQTVDMPAHAPIARHNRFAAVLHGDNSTATEIIGELADQRRWINGLSSFEDRNFTHEGMYWP